MKRRLMLILIAAAALLQADPPTFVSLGGASPLVTLRLVVRTGSASDPKGKEGLAALTAAMLAQGGTRQLTYDQVVEALYPMAVQVGYQVDKEMTTFSADTHVDNLEAFYGIFKSMLLDPGWRENDLKRLKDQTINEIRVSLRANNDEELGKEVLYNLLYEAHPYGPLTLGSASTVGSIGLGDLRQFWRTNYTQGNITVGLAGAYPATFPARIRRDLAVLAPGKRATPVRPAPPALHGWNLHIVDKRTRSVAYSIGFPIEVKRGHADYLALLVAQSFLGPHRSSAGVLFQNLREKRGLNYGDYAYIEYFPHGMFQFEPDPNLARVQQIFQLWIRPVEVPTAHFALRLAFHELDRFIQNGLTPAQFEQTRNFVTKNVNLLTKTKRAELGYAIDSLFYGIPNYGRYVVDGLRKLTVDDVNRAIKKHLQMRNVQVVAISPNGEELKTKLLANEPSPMTYTAEKPKELLEEDKQVDSRKLPFKAEKTKLTPADRLFE